MKYLKSFVVIAMLIGLPAGSWYFLQHGLDWRRVKRDQLLPKGHIVNDRGWTAEEQVSLQSIFKGKTTLLFSDTDFSTKELEVIKQFKDAYTFQTKSNEDLSSHVMAKLAASNDYLLIDTGMVIRQVYKGVEDSTFARMVEDIALVVPHRKDKDIKLKSK